MMASVPDPQSAAGSPMEGGSWLRFHEALTKPGRSPCWLVTLPKQSPAAGALAACLLLAHQLTHSFLTSAGCQHA